MLKTMKMSKKKYKLIEKSILDSGFKSAVVASIASRYVLWAIATKNKAEDSEKEAS